MEIEPAAIEVEILDAEDGLPLAVARGPIEPLSLEAVQAALDELRTRRDPI